MPKGAKFMIDSGAYTAYRSGKEISAAGYAIWLKENISWLSCYVNLDVINPQDPEAAAAAGWKNYEYLKGEGLDPIPVFHAGEDFKWLKRMLDSGCSYIGLAASAMTRKNERNAWYKTAWNYLVDRDGNPVVKVHAFGEGREPTLRQFPWTSADSATWMYRAAGAGGFHAQAGTVVSVRHDGVSSRAAPHIDVLNGTEAEELGAILQRAGVRLAALREPGQQSYYLRIYLEALHYHRKQLAVRAAQPVTHKAHGFDWQPSHKREGLQERDPFRLYLAIAGHIGALAAIALLPECHVLHSHAYSNTRAAHPRFMSAYATDVAAAVSSSDNLRKISNLLKEGMNT